MALVGRMAWMLVSHGLQGEQTYVAVHGGYSTTHYICVCERYEHFLLGRAGGVVVGRGSYK